jgi:DNA-binding MarR family transcriptional regulator
VTSQRRRSSSGELADSLHSVAIHLLRRLRREDDASGVSAPRLSALSVVVFGGPLTLGELARLEQVKPPTMTRIVTGLESQGLVRRTGDTKDKRLTHISATSKGRKVLALGRARRVNLLESALGTLHDRDLQRLRSAVGILTHVVKSIPGPGRTQA